MDKDSTAEDSARATAAMHNTSVEAQLRQRNYNSSRAEGFFTNQLLSMPTTSYPAYSYQAFYLHILTMKIFQYYIVLIFTRGSIILYVYVTLLLLSTFCLDNYRHFPHTFSTSIIIKYLSSLQLQTS